MSYAVDPERRRFCGAVAMTLAATQLDVGALAEAQSNTAPKSPPVKTGTGNSFAPLKQVNAGDLSVAYAEAGPADGPSVLLLHGWPYDIHSFVDVTPLLASAGYQVIVPYARGYGQTRFHSRTTLRKRSKPARAHNV